jgi:cobalt transporter subunit CbtA
MITRTLLTGLLAGLAAGTVFSILYLAGIEPLILSAEAYERGVDHALSGTFLRLAETILFNILTGVAYGLLLAAALVMHGRPTGIGRGVLWGIAGYAAFTLAPGAGLPPELPGTFAAPLEDRQLWWLLASGATAGGIALLVLAPHYALKGAGVLLILLPHMVGAPHPESVGGTVPPELAARFVGLTFGAMALFWVALGGVAGYCHDRFAMKAGAEARA